MTPGSDSAAPQNLFISYSERDRNLIRPLVKALGESTARLHLDEWGASSEAGHLPSPELPWDGILVVSPTALDNQAILAGFARYLKEADRRRRVPILVGAVADVPSFLVGYAWVDFRSRMGRSFQSALEELMDLLQPGE